jgi:hypothetical protein
MATSLLVATIISSLFRLWDMGLVTGDDQAHPSIIVASIVELIRNRPLRCETYSGTMARTDCEDEMLTIVGGEEDGGWLSGWPKSCVDPDKTADGLQLATKFCNGITIPFVAGEPTLNPAIVVFI